MVEENPSDTQQPPAGEPPAGGEPAAQPSGFDRQQLHPALRDMSPTEITDLFETMATTIRTVQSSAAPTRAPDQFTGIPGHATPPAPPKKEAPSKEQYKEMLDPTSDNFDPERAFKAFAEANYGNLVGDINARTIRGLFGTFRTEFDDFKDYESDVIKALEGRNPAELSERDVLNSYLYAKGLRATLAQRTEKARKASTTVPPSPPASAAKVVELTPLEEEIAHKMFRRIADPQKRIEEYRKFAARDDEGGMIVKVPVGGGKSE